jgi:hypothetical protein
MDEMLKNMSEAKNEPAVAKKDVEKPEKDSQHNPSNGNAKQN